MKWNLKKYCSKMKFSESLPFFRRTIRHLLLSNPAHDHDSVYAALLANIHEFHISIYWQTYDLCNTRAVDKFKIQCWLYKPFRPVKAEQISNTILTIYCRRDVNTVRNLYSSAVFLIVYTADIIMSWLSHDTKKDKNRSTAQSRVSHDRHVLRLVLNRVSSSQSKAETPD
jgi:hypothetical protein